MATKNIVGGTDMGTINNKGGNSMVTINKADWLEAIDFKIDEVAATLEALKADPAVQESTKRTQNFQRTREIHNLQVMAALLDAIPGDTVSLEPIIVDYFNRATGLTAVRKAKYTIEVHEGDSVMDLLDKYSSLKDVYKKIQKAVAEAGLRIVGSDIVR